MSSHCTGTVHDCEVTKFISIKQLVYAFRGRSRVQSSQVVDETLFVDGAPPDVRLDRLQRLLELALCRAEAGLARHEVGDVTQLPVSREASR